MDRYDELEIPKHKKKSNRTIAKAKHKHDYKACLLRDLETENYYISEYCAECNKIGNIRFFDSEKNETGYHRMLTNEEVLVKYSNYEIKTIEGIYKSKYV